MISVIVPVYKVEPYLNQCVESILCQTYADLEILLVDDGSPDRCGQICDEYEESFIHRITAYLQLGTLAFKMQKVSISVLLTQTTGLNLRCMRPC